MKRSVKAVNPPSVNKERAVHIHLLVESFCIIFQNKFDHILGSCSYNCFLLWKKECVPECQCIANCFFLGTAHVDLSID